jgi:hypothetical protein
MVPTSVYFVAVTLATGRAVRMAGRREAFPATALTIATTMTSFRIVPTLFVLFPTMIQE